MIKYRFSALLAGLMLSAPLISHAADDNIYQNCLLEGKVIEKQDGDGNNVIRVDFYKAEPYKPEYRCIIDGMLEFKQPAGTIIENLSPGSVVQYHYMKFNNGDTNWQLVGAFI